MCLQGINKQLRDLSSICYFDINEEMLYGVGCPCFAMCVLSNGALMLPWQSFQPCVNTTVHLYGQRCCYMLLVVFVLLILQMILRHSTVHTWGMQSGQRLPPTGFSNSSPGVKSITAVNLKTRYFKWISRCGEFDEQVRRPQ